MAELDRLFRQLDESGVRFVVVGGLAVLLHGHVRLTVDTDLVLDLEPASARRAVDTLLAAGYRPSVPEDPAGFADPERRAEWIRAKGLTDFSWHHVDDPLRVVDLFFESPIPFEELWRRSVEKPFRRRRVHVASIPDLVTKRRAGRPQDLEDIAALERISDLEAGGRT
jgi:hypothetical protein